MNQLEQVKARLLELANGADVSDIDNGSCWDLYVNTRASIRFDTNAFQNMVEGYSEFSGNYEYPVHGVSGESPKCSYQTKRDLWSGEYGISRRHYCRWLSENITEDCYKVIPL